MAHEFAFKFIMLGESGVGKSCLCTRLTKQEFEEGGEMTIGMSYANHKFVVEEKYVKLQIWDFGGQENLRDSMGKFFAAATCAFIVFDLCDRSTFLKLNSWIKCLRERVTNPNLVIYLLGNKVDLADNQWGSIVAQGRGVTKMRTREVSRSEAERFAEANGCKYAETSAKSGINVQDTFEEAARHVLNAIWDGEYEDARNTELHGIHINQGGITPIISSVPRHSAFNPFSCCVPAGIC